MNPICLSVEIIFLVLWLATLLPVLKRSLMMFQQNSYRPDRFRRWVHESSDSTSIMNLFFLIGAFLPSVKMIPELLSLPVDALIMVWAAVKLIKAKYKKPLVLTPRARRLLWMAAAICVAVGAAFYFCFGVKLGATAMMASLFLANWVIMLAAAILKPYENHLNNSFINDAKRIIRSMPDLMVVGITGSYGKTSTKHYLYRILSEHFETLMTPGSYNTTLGVVRTIREMMQPYTEVFIAEMGAKQPGDIREICEIVSPQIGIITAVGEQHLQTFGSIENVQKTKFELIDSLPPDGLAVLNNDFPYVASRKVDNVEAVRYAVRPSDDVQCSVKDVKVDRNGTSFTVVQKGYPELEIRTRLVGECNISNLLAAIVVARRLGVPDEKIARASRQIEQVEHRLNMKHTPGGLTIIDDAFNSNPTGSKMALDVLASLEGGRHFVITPGMIELGDRQQDLNREFGRQIAKSADVAIVVGRYNREAILEGIAEEGMAQEHVHAVDSFAEAQNLLVSMARPGDAVLYENDLPDTFK